MGIKGWKSARAWHGTRSPFKKEPLAEEQGTLHGRPFGGGCRPDGRMTVLLEPRLVNAGVREMRFEDGLNKRVKL